MVAYRTPSNVEMLSAIQRTLIILRQSERHLVDEGNIDLAISILNHQTVDSDSPNVMEANLTLNETQIVFDAEYQHELLINEETIRVRVELTAPNAVVTCGKDYKLISSFDGLKDFIQEKILLKRNKQRDLRNAEKKLFMEEHVDLMLERLDKSKQKSKQKVLMEFFNKLVIDEHVTYAVYWDTNFYPKDLDNKPKLISIVFRFHRNLSKASVEFTKHNIHVSCDRSIRDGSYASSYETMSYEDFKLDSDCSKVIFG